MTDTDLMQLVAGRSPAAMSGALAALRAIRVDSPVVELRVARVAEDALRDQSVEWSPEEREALAEACARAVGADPIDTAARDLLSALLTASGLSAVELARVLGRDERTMRKWLSGQMPVPGAVAEMLSRARVTATQADVTLTYSRRSPSAGGASRQAVSGDASKPSQLPPPRAIDRQLREALALAEYS